MEIADVDSIIPVARGSTEVFRTGEWSPRKPVFLDKISPCREACPAGTDLAGVFSLVAEGDLDGALGLILEENPLPAVCGRVCYQPCQSKCNRLQFDEAVEIRAIERAVADRGVAEPKISSPENRMSVAIIGSGPAGLSAAYFLARFGHGITILEEREEPGGVLRYGIPEYRLPKDVLKGEIGRMLSMGITLTTHIRVEPGGLMDLRDQYDAVFLSTGAWLPRELGVPGENLRDVFHGLSFLGGEQGRAYLEDKKNIVVVGGGDVAVDASRTARRLCGAKARVTVVAPEELDDFPAIPETVGEASAEGIDMVGGYRPLEFEGQRRVELVRLGRTRVERDSETGTYELIPIAGEDLPLKADLVIVAIGQVPDGSLFPPEIVGEGVPKVCVDDRGMTSIPGVYAGGDLVGGRASVVDAIASGKRAALAMHMGLRGEKRENMGLFSPGNGSSLSVQAYTMGTPFDLARVIQFADLNTLLFPRSLSHRSGKLEPDVRLRDFREVNIGLDRAAAIEEARRCFYCGRCSGCDLCLLLCPDLSILREGHGDYRVNADYCKGCGICIEVCPRSVIEVQEGDEGASHR